MSSFITYYRWYSNAIGNTPGSDTFVIEISNDNGLTWVTLETVGPAGNEVSGGWHRKSFEISDFLAPTNQMRIRFNASDLGQGSLVEAGVDGVSIILVQCDEDFVLGDTNLDGEVNFFDIEPFIGILSSNVFLEQADCNQDGVVNFLDISAFIAILASS